MNGCNEMNTHFTADIEIVVIDATAAGPAAGTRSYNSLELSQSAEPLCRNMINLVSVESLPADDVWLFFSKHQRQQLASIRC